MKLKLFLILESSYRHFGRYTPLTVNRFSFVYLTQKHLWPVYELQNLIPDYRTKQST